MPDWATGLLYASAILSILIGALTLERMEDDE
jgi:predicted outer membrane lipoprotein